MTITVPTGSEVLDALLGGGVPRSASVILQGPPGEEKEAIAWRFLKAGWDTGGSALVLLSSMSPRKFRETLEALGVAVKTLEDAKRLVIVDWYTYREEAVADIQDEGSVLKVNVDLTNVGVAVSWALNRLAEGGAIRAVLEVVSPALNAYDLKEVYPFAQVTKAKLERRDATALFLVEKEMHDAATLSNIQQPFDGVIDIERVREGDRIVRKIGVPAMRGSPLAAAKYLPFEPEGSVTRPSASSTEPARSPASAPAEAQLSSAAKPIAGPGAAQGPEGQRRPCPSCGTSLPESEKLCYSCGASLSRAADDRLAVLMRTVDARLAKDAADLDALFVKGAALARMERWEESITSLNEITKLEPAYPGVWILKAKIYARIGKPKMARACRERAMELQGKEKVFDAAGTPAGSKKIAIVEASLPTVPLPRPTEPIRRRRAIAPSKGLTNGLSQEIFPRDRAKIGGLTNGRGGRTNGLVNGRGRTNGLVNGRGRTNGLVNGEGRTNGLVNGRGRTNGLVNGLSAARASLADGLTNGTGFTNGLGGIRYFREARIQRWKLYFIPLVAALLLIAPLLAPGAPSGTSPITIDGGFTDWSDSDLVAAGPNPQLNPNIDIVRFGIADNVDSVAFYVEVAGAALQGGGPAPGTMDAIRIFVDSDASAATGYRVDGLGADRMIEVLGIGGEVRGNRLFEFDAARNVRDWNGWVKPAAIPAAVQGSRLEVAADWLLLESEASKASAVVRTQSWNGQVDAGDLAVGLQRGSLVLTQQSQAPAVLAGTNVPLLSLRATAERRAVSFDSLSVRLVGTAAPFASTALRLVNATGRELASRIPIAADVQFTFMPEIVPARASSFYTVLADFAPGVGDTMGLDVPSANGVGTTDAVVTLRTTAPTRSVGYVGVIPSGARVDGGFSEWTATVTDPAGEPSTRGNANIDLRHEGVMSNASFLSLYADVAGHAFAGTPVPQAPEPATSGSTGVADSDRDTVPDSIDPLPYDFNNDGIPDAQTGGDVDGDGVIDYGRVGGVDYWLNTTLPASFPAPYAGKAVSLYIGPTNRPVVLGEDALRFFLDTDNVSWTGYAIGGIGADRMVEVRGKDGAVTQSAVLSFRGSFPGDWNWNPDYPVTVGTGYNAVELAVPFNASRVYVEAGDFWGGVDATSAPLSRSPSGPRAAFVGATDPSNSFGVAPAARPLSVPWAVTGPQTTAIQVDPGSNSATTVYNQQRKVVRAGDTPGTACDATNSDGCWYTAFYDQLAEQATTAPQSPKVQNGQSTLAAGTSTLNVSITSIVTTKTFVTFSASFSDANPDFSQISGQIIDATTIRFQRAKSVGAPAITIEWYVAEFNRGVTVQRNSTTMTGNTVNVPISSVALTKSFPIVTYRKSGTGYGSDDFLKAKITTSTNLQLSLYNITVFDGVAEWQVIEYTDASVQTGDVTFNPETSKTVTIPAVDETKAWLLFTYTADNGSIQIGPKMMRGMIMNPTTLVFDRNLTFVTLILTWYLVVFTDTTSVQSWRVYFATGQTQKDISIECIDPTKTIVTAGGMYYRGGRSWTTSDDNPGFGTVTLDLTTSTNLRLVRGGSSQDADIGWFVVEFGTGCPVTGMFPADIQAADGSFIQYREANIGQTAASNNPTAVGTSPACTFSSCSNGETSDDTYAVSPSDGDIASYKTLGFNIPAGSTITRVRFGVEVFQTGNFDEHLEQMSLSWNAGSNYCGNTFIMIPVGPPDPDAYTFMDQTTCTGHTWSASDFTGDLIAWKGVHIKTGGANPIDLDAVIVEVAYTPPSYKLAIQYDWSGVTAGADVYTVKVKGYRQDENVNVQVMTPPSTWNTRINIVNTSNTLYSYDLTASEFNSGAPSIRFVDAAGGDGTASDLWVDYAALVSTTYWDRVILMRSTNASGSAWGTQITLASGRTVDSPVLLARDSTEPSIAIDSAGFLHASWAAAGGAGNQQTMNLIRYSKTTVAWPTQAQLNSSANWETVTNVDDANPGFMPTVSTDTSNNPHIAWSGSKTSGTVYYKNRAAGWRPTVSWGSTYTGLSVDVSPQNNFVSLARYYEAGTNEIQYTVCKNLGSNQCDAASEFTKADNSSGYDTVATGVELASYPSLATTWDANGDLWVAYAKDVDGTTRAIYARFLDYPTTGWLAVTTVDSLSGTIFSRPSIGIDRNNDVHALYVATSGPQLYYNKRTGGAWGSREAVGTSTDNPTLMVRAPNDATYGTATGGLYWKTSTSETYFYYVPEFSTLIVPIAGLLFLGLMRRKRTRVGGRAAAAE